MFCPIFKLLSTDQGFTEARVYKAWRDGGTEECRYTVRAPVGEFEQVTGTDLLLLKEDLSVRELRDRLRALYNNMDAGLVAPVPEHRRAAYTQKRLYYYALRVRYSRSAGEDTSVPPDANFDDRFA